ncbi:hypothetical protein ACU686_37280 [Yinghuangia aomiensis]
MTAVRYEWTRLATGRGLWWSGLGTLAVGAATTWAGARELDAMPVRAADAAQLVTRGHRRQHHAPGRPRRRFRRGPGLRARAARAALPALLIALPHRTRTLAAKVAVTALLAVTAACVGIVVNAAVAAARFEIRLPRTRLGPSPGAPHPPRLRGIPRARRLSGPRRRHRDPRFRDRGRRARRLPAGSRTARRPRRRTRARRAVPRRGPLPAVPRRRSHAVRRRPGHRPQPRHRRPHIRLLDRSRAPHPPASSSPAAKPDAAKPDAASLAAAKPGRREARRRAEDDARRTPDPWAAPASPGTPRRPAARTDARDPCPGHRSTHAAPTPRPASAARPRPPSYPTPHPLPGNFRQYPYRSSTPTNLHKKLLSPQGPPPCGETTPQGRSPLSCFFSRDRRNGSRRARRTPR